MVSDEELGCLVGCSGMDEKWERAGKVNKALV